MSPKATTPKSDTPEVPAPVLPAEVEVVVLVAISGLRNGEPWPAPGEPIVLPEAEAAGYLKFGYVKAKPDAE